MILQSHIVHHLDQPVRLSDYVAGIFEDIPSKKGMRKAIKKNLVLVNGLPAETGRWLNGGELIELMDDAREHDLPTFEQKLQVLMEDDHIAVIAKPAGLEVNGNKFKTVENALPNNLRPSPLDNALPRPQAIHRLDHPTSGVLLIGKTRSAVRELNRQFEQKEVRKIYHAINIGEMPDSGTITELVDGKASESAFVVLKRQASPRFEYLNLLQLFPVTGRRHQLRKHLAGIGHPILGDSTYFLEGKIYTRRGLFLHATSLTFTHPDSGERITIEAELPKKFGRVMG
ncbi:MAG: RluA family pseudouridine synthase [Bacteroidia bacterium]|nr:RluA family pseudouridine synthase [Bacteroidia bacterium]